VLRSLFLGASLGLFATLPVLLPGCASTPGAGTPGITSGVGSATSGNATTRAFHTLLAEEWKHRLEEAPQWASSIGERRYDDRWDDVSLKAVARREAYDRDLLGRVKALARADLSRDDALSYDLFRLELETAVDGQPFRLHLFPLNQRGGIQSVDDIGDELPFDTKKSFEDYNKRLATFGTYMDQTLEVLAEGIRVRMVHPRVAMARVPAQIDAQIVNEPGKSGFFKPYDKARAAGTGNLTPGDRDRLEAEAKRHIETVVVPAFRKMRAFFTERYLPACREGSGAWELPEGEKLYAYTVRKHTTTRLTPDAIHAMGLREVARIRGEMESAKARAGFKGSMKEFFTFLRTDPRFYFKDGQELIAAYRDLSKRVDPLLVKVFGKLPRTPYGVAAIPDAVAPDTTTAYYREPSADGSRAGTYFVNLYKPEARPRWEMTALTLHESVPGHHLQIALAMENEQIPLFRRHGDYNAFVEGWALYAESLGEEMGLYDDPYARFGQLTYEMWRAVRLVVDTGLHHLKWDRQRAIDFFLENAAKTEQDVTNEVDRYTVWPGQALGYKIGELRIKELRKKSSAALGARFDVKKFHESVLRAGPLPLDVLEREVMDAR